MTDTKCENGSATEIGCTPRAELQSSSIGPEPSLPVNGNGSSTVPREDRPHRGRRSKFCAAVVEKICQAIGDGLPFKFAAALGGISIDTFCEWRRNNSEFSAAIEEALAKGVHERVKIIAAAAQKGDLKAAMWWLEHTQAEHFAKNRVEHGGEVGVTVKPKMDDQILQRLREAYKKRIRMEVLEELRKSNALPEDLER